MQRIERKTFWALWLASLGLLSFLLTPIASLVSWLSPSALITHIQRPEVLQALWLSLRTTGISTLICVVLGTPVAYLLARFSFRGREALDTLTDLPITIPPVVAGVALLLAFGRRGLIGHSLNAFGVDISFTTAAVVMAQVFIASPFYVKSARSGFEAVDPQLEAVAMSMGASRWTAFWLVTVPLARPSLFGGIVLAWARALSEFGATMMFAGNFPGRTQTLTLAVMSAMETDLDTAVAISAISLVLALCTLLGAKILLHHWRVPGA